MLCKVFLASFRFCIASRRLGLTPRREPGRWIHVVTLGNFTSQNTDLQGALVLLLADDARVQ